MTTTEGTIIAACGPPRSGKTDLILRALSGVPSEYLIVAVDRHGDFPDRLSDGTYPPIRDLSLARLGLLRWMEIEHLHGQRIYVLSGRAESAALEWCLDHSSRERPILLYIDEMGQWGASSRHRIQDVLSNYIAGRRHTGLSLVIGCQYARQIHYSVFSMCDGAILFGMSDKSDLARLAEGGIPDSVCVEVRDMGATFQRAVDTGQPLPHDFLWCPRLQPTPAPLKIDTSRKATGSL